MTHDAYDWAGFACFTNFNTGFVLCFFLYFCNNNMQYDYWLTSHHFLLYTTTQKESRTPPSSKANFKSCIFFYILTTISYLLLSVINMNVHATLKNFDCQTHHCSHHFWNTLTTACVHVYCLVTINIQQVSVNVSRSM